MENCKYETDVKRILKILDGNSKPGLIIEVAQMELKLSDIIELANANVKAIHALNLCTQDMKIINEERDRVREKRESRNSKLIYFVVAQTIIILIAVLGYFFTQ